MSSRPHDVLVDAIFYVGFLLFLIFMFILPMSCHDSGIEKGRCTERWKYQKTQFDTLQTIRSGCSEPERK